MTSTSEDDTPTFFESQYGEVSPTEDQLADEHATEHHIGHYLK